MAVEDKPQTEEMERVQRLAATTGFFSAPCGTIGLGLVAFLVSASLTGCEASTVPDAVEADSEIVDVVTDTGVDILQDIAPDAAQDVDVAKVEPWEEFAIAPEHCDPPAELPLDSIENRQTVKSGLHISHLMDVEGDPDRDTILFGYGFPGLYIFERDAEGVWAHVGMYPQKNVWDGYQYVPDLAEFAYGEPLGNNIVVLSARGQKPPSTYVGSASKETHGLFFVDTSIPDDPIMLAELDLYDLSGVARQGDLLYALSFSGSLHIIDISDVSNPKHLGFTSLFFNSWRILPMGDVAYVADNYKGLVVVDLSEPTEPSVIKTVKAAGGIQDFWVSKGHLYAAVGKPGVQVFDLSDPKDPKALGTHTIGPSVIGISESDDVLWVTNNEAAAAFSLKDPSNPELIGYEETSDWALNVYARGGLGYISDWDYVHVLEAFPDRKAPEIDPHPEEVYFVDPEERTRTMTLTNRGRSDLVITGMKTASDAYEVRAERLTIPAGEESKVYVTLKEDSEPEQTTLCIASNDPDESVKELLVGPASDNSQGAKVGDDAPDFVLPEINSGEKYQLSDYIGQPIYLCFFSSW